MTDQRISADSVGRASADVGRDRRAILVLGPHRSGTSVITHALQCAGAHLGCHLLEANVDNPKGFFENASIVAFNDRLLKHVGICWDYLGPLGDRATQIAGFDQWVADAADLIGLEFGTSTLIAIKDPRLCLLAPFWERVLSITGFDTDHVLVLRHPGECALSQRARQRRDPAFHFVGEDLESGLLLWARYMYEALRYLAGRSTVIASYPRFLATPMQELSCMCRALDLTAEAAAADFGRSFLDPTLHRQHSDTLQAESVPRADDFVRVWQELETLDVSQRHGGAAHADAVRRLEAVLAKEPEFSDATLRAFVHARHAAVEAGLELAHAKRIIAFQEHALKDLEQRADELQGRTTDAERRVLEARQRVQHLELENATLRDRLSPHDGHR